MDITNTVHGGPWSKELVESCVALTEILKLQIRKLPAQEAINKLDVLPSGLDMILIRDVWSLVDCFETAIKLGYHINVSLVPKD